MDIDRQKDLYGLVLIGGESKRMKQDKAMLSYHGKEQYRYCYELLEKYCSQVFLSLREDQVKRYDMGNYNVVLDKKEFLGKGPLAGMITAMKMYPEKSFLVLACDLPNVNEKTIRELIAKRTGEIATAFKSSSDGLPEPLCAIYEKEILPILIESFDKNMLCPRKILISAHISLINPVDVNALNNVNKADELREYETNRGERDS